MEKGKGDLKKKNSKGGRIKFSWAKNVLTHSESLQRILECLFCAHFDSKDVKVDYESVGIA